MLEVLEELELELDEELLELDEVEEDEDELELLLVSSQDAGKLPSPRTFM